MNILVERIKTIGALENMHREYVAAVDFVRDQLEQGKRDCYKQFEKHAEKASEQILFLEDLVSDIRGQMEKLRMLNEKIEKARKEQEEKETKNQ